MPRRWLSIRGQQKESVDDVTALTRERFDFDFHSPPAQDTSPATQIKSAMFSTSRRPKDASLKPQTLDGSKPTFDKRLHLTKVEDSWIGVAFGSPTHPPAAYPSFMGNESAVSLHHAFRHEGPLPAVPPVPKTRKFGSLFKLRSSPVGTQISAPTQVYKIDGGNPQATPILLERKPLPIARALPELMVLDTEVTTGSYDFLPDVSKETSQNTIPVPVPPVKRTSLPKLEIQIPCFEMDRYSVMFRDVSGVKPSNLLERRSRNLNNLRLARKESTDVPPVPTRKPPPPLVTPTTPKGDSLYDLFPTPPKSTTPSKSRNASKDLRSSLPKIQLSYPNEPESPITQSIPLIMPVPVPVPVPAALVLKPIEQCTPSRDKGSETASMSPDDTVASSDRDDTPWRSGDSVASTPPSSCTSMSSEIFFDLKPCEDSSGEEQSEIVIHKPDSPTIKSTMPKSHRRNKSKASRRDSFDSDQFNMSPDLQAAEYMLRAEDEWRLSIQLNQAIAEVERLTSPSNSVSPQVELQNPMDQIHEEPVRTLLPAIRLRNKLDELMLSIPSPITERTEVSPYLSPMIPIVSQPRTHIAALSIRPPPLSVDNEPWSANLPSDIPPPVPMKDAKYLPVSKLASITTEKPRIVESSSRPINKDAQLQARQKPNRSFTETSVDLTAQQTPSIPPRHPDHTLSLSHISAQNSRRASSRNSHESRYSQKSSQLLSPNSRKLIESGIVALAVKPTAEVSVARKVSLKRNSSHPILLRTGSSGRSSEAGISESPSREKDTRFFERSSGVSAMSSRSMSPQEIREFHINHRSGLSMDTIVEGMGGN